MCVTGEDPARTPPLGTEFNGYVMICPGILISAHLSLSLSERKMDLSYKTPHCSLSMDAGALPAGNPYNAINLAMARTQESGSRLLMSLTLCRDGSAVHLGHVALA